MGTLEGNDVCKICVSSFSKTKRKEIKCPKCGEVCCRDCLEKFLFRVSKEPHCMFCNVFYDQVFINENISASFMKKLNQNKIQLLIEDEKVLLPETQRYIEYDNYINCLEEVLLNFNLDLKIINSNLSNLEKVLPVKHCPNKDCLVPYVYHNDKFCYSCKHNICSLCRTTIYTDVVHVCCKENIVNFDIYKGLMKERMDLFRVIDYNKNKIQKWNNNFETDQSIYSADKRTYKVVCNCIRSDCTGIVTNKNYTCQLCGTTICHECHKLLDDKHVCCNEDVLSIEIMRKLSKICPKCSSQIEKVDGGCNQMWCTNCNTAFDWNTGKIEVGKSVHNPHYFEWLQLKNNIHTSCEGIPDQRHFVTHITIVVKNNNLHFYELLNLYFKILIYVNNIILLNTNVNIEPVLKNLDLRLKWVRNKITIQEWGSSLLRRFKKDKMKHIKNEVFNMFTTVSTDITHKILACNEYFYMKNFVEEWKNLIKYTNDCFENLKNIFSFEMPCIKVCDNYDFVVKNKRRHSI
jgi:hypothetical protein